MRWNELQVSDSLARRLSTQLSISVKLASLMVSRGIRDEKEADSFLRPKLGQLADPFDIPNLESASLRLCDAIAKKEKVLIIGDYDVDGITSTVILTKLLASLGLESKYVIPFRKTEGYGLSHEVLSRGLKLDEFSLVVSLDCGTNSSSEAKFLEKNQIDLVIVDHHKAKEDIHPHPIILNPHLEEKGKEKSTIFCTAGLTFKLAHGIIKELRSNGNAKAFEVSPKNYLALCALGTLADMVPLVGENRTLVRYGLKHLRSNPGTGLQSLIKLANFDHSFPFDSEDVTFRIAPRINACGRLNDPEVAAQLLLTEDYKTAEDLASKMDAMNEERKSIESRLSEQALMEAEERFQDEKAAVIFGEGPEWHPGVVGIVAGKLANKLNKPCIVLGFDGGKFKGSGRSPNGINLVKAMTHCKDLFDHWGGHPAAIGLTIDSSNLPSFIESFLSSLKEEFSDDDHQAYLTIDHLLEVDDISPELLTEIDYLGPFGQDNPEPVFALKELTLQSPPRIIGNGNHFQFKIESGHSFIPGIAWNMSESIPPISKKVDLAFKIRWNRWNRQNNPQVVLVDWKLSVENQD